MTVKSIKKYTDYIVDEVVKLLTIDSPTGYTDEAAAFVLAEFEKLGIIFMDTDSALQEYPEIFEEYFGFELKSSKKRNIFTRFKKVQGESRRYFWKSN